MPWLLKRSTNTGSENRKRFANSIEHTCKFKDREKIKFNLEIWQTEKEGGKQEKKQKNEENTGTERYKKYNIKRQKTTEK
jgi:hypothetical protein